MNTLQKRFMRSTCHGLCNFITTLVMILKDCRIARIACRRFFSFVFYPRHLQKGISSFSIFLSHCDMWSFKCHDKTWVFMTIRKHLQSSHNFIKWCRLRFVLFIRQRFLNLAPVVQRLDNTIHRINRYPVDKCWQNKPRYPLDSDLSGG